MSRATIASPLLVGMPARGCCCEIPEAELTDSSPQSAMKASTAWVRPCVQRGAPSSVGRTDRRRAWPCRSGAARKRAGTALCACLYTQKIPQKAGPFPVARLTTMGMPFRLASNRVHRRSASPLGRANQAQGAMRAGLDAHTQTCCSAVRGSCQVRGRTSRVAAKPVSRGATSAVWQSSTRWRAAGGAARQSGQHCNNCAALQPYSNRVQLHSNRTTTAHRTQPYTTAHSRAHSRTQLHCS